MNSNPTQRARIGRGLQVAVYLLALYTAAVMVYWARVGDIVFFLHWFQLPLALLAIAAAGCLLNPPSRPVAYALVFPTVLFYVITMAIVFGGSDPLVFKAFMVAIYTGLVILVARAFRAIGSIHARWMLRRMLPASYALPVVMNFMLGFRMGEGLAVAFVLPWLFHFASVDLNTKRYEALFMKYCLLSFCGLALIGMWILAAINWEFYKIYSSVILTNLAGNPESLENAIHMRAAYGRAFGWQVVGMVAMAVSLVLFYLLVPTDVPKQRRPDRESAPPALPSPDSGGI